MKIFLLELKVAYAGFWKWIGILFAATSVFSWGAKALSIPLSMLTAQLVKAYQGVFHPVVEFLFGWVQWVLPFQLPLWWPDAVVFYCVAGGAVARTFVSVYSRRSKPTPRDLMSVYPSHGIYGIGQSRRPLALLAAFVFAFAAWPVALPDLLTRPHFVKTEWSDDTGPWERFGALPRWDDRFKRDDSLSYVFDLRHVLALQVAAVVAVVGLFSILNSMPQ